MGAWPGRSRGSDVRDLQLVLVGCLVVGLTALFACDSAPPPAGSRMVADVEIQILNPDRPAALRCNPEVRIAEKVSSEVLVSLSRALLEEEAAGCGFGFAAYYLPAMQPGSGAWAIAELGPEVRVSMLGLSGADESVLLQRALGAGETLGIWVDDTSYASVIALYRDAGGLKLGRWYADGGTATEPVRVAKGQSGECELRDAATSGERHHRIGGGGDLESWDGGGFLAAARMVQLDVDLARLTTEEASRRSRRALDSSAGRSLAEAAAAQERWRKFSEWLAIYRDSLDPARHVTLDLGTPQSRDQRAATCAELAELLERLPVGELRVA
ncbi:MAG TPA: hypothetical protein VNB06_18890, partial [Thermoanaerobaculia bacterium]|nr:hypothetical protein [Thermoanaerobaculia bacterium]